MHTLNVDETSLRSPPHSLPAEKAVLGAVLLSPETFGELSNELRTDDFFLPAHREIWDAMAEIRRRGRSPDVISLGDELKARGMIERLEKGEGYLFVLANESTLYTQAHVQTVQEKAQLRRLIASCAEVQSRAYGDVGDVGEFLDSSNAQLSRATSQSQTSDLVTVGDLIDPVIAEIGRRAERYASGDEMASVTGVRTGIKALDLLTSGFQPGNLVVLAAGTSSGKTALAAQMAIENCLGDKGASLVINLEMTRLELAERAFVHVGQVNSADVRRGSISYDDRERLRKASQKLVMAKLYVEDSSYRLRELSAKFRRFRAKHKDGKLVGVVDFLQLVRGEETRGLNRAQEVGRTAQALKELGKELGMPIVLLSQLDRSWVKQERPTKYNLKESGDVENAADIIILIHNKHETSDGNVGLYVDKNRNGQCKLVIAHWEGRHYRFRDADDNSGFEE